MLWKIVEVVRASVNPNAAECDLTCGRDGQSGSVYSADRRGAEGAEPEVTEAPQAEKAAPQLPGWFHDVKTNS